MQAYVIFVVVVGYTHIELLKQKAKINWICLDKVAMKHIGVKRHNN